MRSALPTAGTQHDFKKQNDAGTDATSASESPSIQPIFNPVAPSHRVPRFLGPNAGGGSFSTSATFDLGRGHPHPPGYQLRIGGERAKQIDGFSNLKVVLLISLIGIYLALLVQFNNAVKPLLVFAAAPYGVIGSLIALAVTHTPFGFMAFLGIASLIGVIVSHVIVLFDFIEEMHAKGEPLEQALPDAGIQRIRPVVITVLATILALFPLALEGGPLWQPLCYAQIGGLAVATFITLLLVPVLYSIFVLDLKIIRWDSKETSKDAEPRASSGSLTQPAAQLPIR
jgi:Cu/Ag efflux pump CusA